MSDDPEDAIEMTRREVDGRTVFVYQRQRGSALARKLKMGGLLVAGVALGTVAFLCLASLLWLLLPVLAFVVLVSVVSAWLRPRTSSPWR
ncbi:MAG: hypothetical protein U1E76_00815 [Planctomycetota bacterium]